jgi:hypothetical protein
MLDTVQLKQPSPGPRHVWRERVSTLLSVALAVSSVGLLASTLTHLFGFEGEVQRGSSGALAGAAAVVAIPLRDLVNKWLHK